MGESGRVGSVSGDVVDRGQTCNRFIWLSSRGGGCIRFYYFRKSLQFGSFIFFCFFFIFSHLEGAILSHASVQVISVFVSYIHAKEGFRGRYYIQVFFSLSLSLSSQRVLIGW